MTRRGRSTLLQSYRSNRPPFHVKNGNWFLPWLAIANLGGRYWARPPNPLGHLRLSKPASITDDVHIHVLGEAVATHGTVCAWTAIALAWTATALAWTATAALAWTAIAALAWTAIALAWTALALAWTAIAAAAWTVIALAWTARALAWTAFDAAAHTISAASAFFVVGFNRHFMCPAIIAVSGHNLGQAATAVEHGELVRCLLRAIRLTQLPGDYLSFS